MSSNIISRGAYIMYYEIVMFYFLELNIFSKHEGLISNIKKLGKVFNTHYQCRQLQFFK